MILETLLSERRGELNNVLEDLLTPGVRRNREDDIRVRAYVVRSHWRRRWHPKVKSLEAARRRRNA